MATAVWPGGAVHAQDLEVASEVAGIPLPPSYWQEKAKDPLAFELPNGLFGSRENLPPLATPGVAAQPARAPFLGTARLPVILALFSDSPEPWLTPDDVDASIFTGPAPHGTLTEYYSAASYGQFTVEGDVTPWVRTATTRSEAVGDNYGLGGDSGAGEYLVQALELADPDLDFRLYDNDGPDGIPDSGDDDGIADAVTFEFLEVSASCGGPGIWPHRWGISGWTDGRPWASDDVGASGQPILVDAYIIQGATNCSGTQVQTAATIAHEFGHVLGLPDYYHAMDGIEPEFRRWVLGCWDLMAAGSWGCGPVGTRSGPFGPTHMTAYNRWRLGWLEPRDVGLVRDTVMELAPIRTTGQALRIPLAGSTAGPVLLVEYRDHQGFDADTPGAGVLVIRVDPDGALRPSSGYRYRASVVEADGDQGLFRNLAEGGDRGMATDLFGLPGGPSRLNNVSTPGTLAPDGSGNGVAIHDIALNAGGATIHLTNHLDPVLKTSQDTVTTAALESITLNFLVTGGALPVRVQLDDGAGGPVERILAVEGLEVDGDRIQLTGVPVAAGERTLRLSVKDLYNSPAAASVLLQVDPWEPLWEEVVEGYFDPSALSDLGRQYLDSQGNSNGSLDVGDLRAWRFGPGGS